MSNSDARMNLRKLLPIASVAGKVTGAAHYTVWNTDTSDRGGERADHAQLDRHSQDGRR
jgi:hypothetical protein